MTYPGVEMNDIVSPAVQESIQQAMTGMDADDRFALTGWGKVAKNKTFDVKCPSGQWCKLKKLQFEEILDLGILDNLDTFRAVLLAQAGTPESSGAAEIKMLESFQDKEKRSRFLGTVNRVVKAGVVAPKLSMVDPEGGLPDGTVFIGDVDYQDKMFLFGLLFSGRMSQLDQFREEQNAAVGDVAESESVS